MRSKAFGVIFALIFAIGFGAGGYFGIATLLGQLNGWSQARSWQAVPATVLHAELQAEQGEESMTYRVVARYRYDLGGHSYEGTRVGFSGGSDNIGSWQSEHHALLSRAMQDRRPIEVWVDPRNPANSVVDRDLRWGMVAFSIPFATLFPLISFGAAWILVKVLRTPAADFASPSKPAKAAANPRDIHPDLRDSPRMLWFFAIFWGAIAFPVAFIVVPQTFGRSLVWLFVMIFPSIGVLLIWAAIAKSLQFSRNGGVILRLSPAQPRLGEPVAVRANFSGTPPSGRYVFTLLCEEVDTSGDNDRHRSLWKREENVSSAGNSASAEFSPPSNLPASEGRSALYRRWRVLLRFPDGKDERAFDVTIA